MDATQVDRTVERWSQVARDAGHKLTHQRLEIFRALAADDAHPDAESVFRAVAPHLPTVSLDTVYRTLWMLHELGLITTLGHRHDGIRFDPRLDRHHHFVCVQCGLVRDFHSDALDALRVPESLSDLGAVLDARVEVRGVCADCRARGTAVPPTDRSPRSDTP